MHTPHLHACASSTGPTMRPPTYAPLSSSNRDDQETAGQPSASGTPVAEGQIRLVLLGVLVVGAVVVAASGAGSSMLEVRAHDQGAMRGLHAARPPVLLLLPPSSLSAHIALTSLVLPLAARQAHPLTSHPSSPFPSSSSS